MRKILVGVPILNSNHWVEQALKAVAPQCDELLVIDNGATPQAKALIKPYNKIVNERNIYVNPAWNQIMKYYLESSHDYLVILNSDLILGKNAIDRIRRVNLDEEKVNILAHQVDNFSTVPTDETILLNDGQPGIMIVMNRTMCELVYPIPPDLRLWYGDNWVYCKLQKAGYKFVIYTAIEAKHGLSKSVNWLPDSERGAIIDSDKANWETKYRFMI